MAQEQPQSMLGALYNWGGSMISYAQDTINSFMGWEDLDVVDPDAQQAEKGGKKQGDGMVVEERKQAWGSRQFQQYIGMDVTSLLSVPVWIMEPFTILQKAAEIMEYADMLDKADKADDAALRMAWVAAWCVSPFGAAERAWKPFNPILGETFELDMGDNVRYLAEQVSHHPPVCAAHAENAHFTYDVVSAPTTKFLGNSLEVYPYSRSRVTLKQSGETYSWVPPNAMVHNIVIGRTWIDAFGPLTVRCPASGTNCVLDFQACGWFGYGRYEFSGYVTDKEGVKRYKLSGKWSSYCDVVACNEDGTPFEGAEPLRVWTCADKPKGDYYSFTNFAHELNGCKGQRVPLPSDSRRRPDRSRLAAKDFTGSGADKYRLEEMQRAEKREREKRGEAWVPRFFEAVEDPSVVMEGEADLAKVPHWRWTGAYDKLEREPLGTAKAEEVDGKGFCPWQYADMHEKL